MKKTISPEPAVLGFLLNNPMHGYDLYKQVNTCLGLVWHVGLSQLYAIIHVYAERDWIRMRLHAQGARPTKKILELTATGQKAFEQWLAQPARGLREFRVDFFVRLYFARTTRILSAKQLVEQQITASQKELEMLCARETAVADSENDFNRLTRSFRIQQLTTILKWLENNRSDLTQSKISLRMTGNRKARQGRRKKSS